MGQPNDRPARRKQGHRSDLHEICKFVWPDEESHRQVCPAKEGDYTEEGGVRCRVILCRS